MTKPDLTDLLLLRRPAGAPRTSPAGAPRMSPAGAGLRRPEPDFAGRMLPMEELLLETLVLVQTY